MLCHKGIFFTDGLANNERAFVNLFVFDLLMNTVHESENNEHCFVSYQIILTCCTDATGNTQQIPSLAATVCLFNTILDQGLTTLLPNAKCGDLRIKCGDIKFGRFLKKVILPNGICHFFYVTLLYYTSL